MSPDEETLARQTLTRDREERNRRTRERGRRRLRSGGSEEEEEVPRPSEPNEDSRPQLRRTDESGATASPTANESRRTRVNQALSSLNQDARITCPFCRNRSYVRIPFLARHLFSEHDYELSPDEETLARQTLTRDREERNRRTRRRGRRRLRSGGNEEDEEGSHFREYPTFYAMLGPPPPLEKLPPPPLPSLRYLGKGGGEEEEITDAPRKRKRNEAPIFEETAKETLPPMNKKRIGENKSILPLPKPLNLPLKLQMLATQKNKNKYRKKPLRPSNLPLKLKMQAAQKIKKKYIKMAYPKLSLRKKKGEK